MSIQKMAEVWKYSQNAGSLLLVELAIADHINGAGIAWPSIKHLAKKTKLSERQIQRVIKKLEQTGQVNDIAMAVKSLTINKTIDETIKEPANTFLISKTPAEDIWEKLLKALKG